MAEMSQRTGYSSDNSRKRDRSPSSSSNVKKSTRRREESPVGRLSGSSCERLAEAVEGMQDVLAQLVRRVAQTERAIREVKELIQKAPKGREKQTVPLKVRSEMRKVYKVLRDEDSEFDGFNLGPESSFKDEGNQVAAAKLVREVHVINPSFQGSDIRAAVGTYYKTLSQEDSVKRRGLGDGRKGKRRRKERMIRKLQSREAMMAKTRLSDKERLKWSKVMVLDMMSSDESDAEIISVKDLPWRSHVVTNFFNKLDNEASISKSDRAKRQTKQRVLGIKQSSRPKPPLNKFPSWATT